VRTKPPDMRLSRENVQADRADRLYSAETLTGVRNASLSTPGNNYDLSTNVSTCPLVNISILA
jgi:hypothetical protein